VPPWLLAQPAESTTPAAAPRASVSTRVSVIAGVLAACVAVGSGLWVLAGRQEFAAPVSSPTAVPARDAVASAPVQTPGETPAVAPPGEGPPPAAATATSGQAAVDRPARPAVETRARLSAETSVRTVADRPATMGTDQQRTIADSPVKTSRTVPAGLDAPLDATAVLRTVPPPVSEHAPVVPPLRANETAAGAASAPPPLPPVAPVRDEEAAIRNIVGLYARALNEKSLSLLARVRPSLSRTEAEALLKSMPSTHTVAFRDMAVNIHGTTASILLTRQDVVRDATTPLQTGLRLTLKRQGDSWVIDRIQRAQ
jgi:hypothetical protein